MKMTLTGALVMVIVIGFTQGQDIINKVTCREDREEQQIQCGDDEIINIQSVTVAYVADGSPCTVDHLIPVIEGLSEECRTSGEDGLGNPYGSEVYKRCHGEQSCTVDGSVVSQQHLLHPCGGNQDYRANVMRFNYTCFKANNMSPNLTPIPLNRDVTGTRVDLFSPYYPCNAPRAEYKVSCRVIPQKSDSLSGVSFIVVPKLVRFPVGAGTCGDYLYFRKDTTRLGTFYCNNAQGGVEAWNDQPITVFAYHFFEINYKIGKRGVGGKFWLQIEANENQVPVSLDVECTGQEYVPEPPASCSSFVFTTTSTTTTSTTPEITFQPTESSATNNLTDKEYVIVENPSSSGSAGMLGGLVGASVVIVIVVIVAVVLGCKLRQSRRARANERPAQPVTSDGTQEAYETIPDDLVSPNGGYPTMYSTPIGIPDVGTYEDVAAKAANVNQIISTNHQNMTDAMESIENTNDDGDNNIGGYVNAALVGVEVENGAANVEYEDVKENAPYEALKRVEYENTKNMDENKVYTGLDNNKRHSKV